MIANSNGASRPKPLREQAREAVRAAILEAAQKRFGEQGYRNTKMAEIARDAGVAAGTLYNYFASKEAVFDAIVRIEGDASFAVIEQDLAACDSPFDALDTLVHAVLRAIESNRQIYSILVEVQMDHDSTVIKAAPGSAADALRKRFTHLTAKVLQDAQQESSFSTDQPEDLLAGLLGLCTGFLSAWISSNQAFSLIDKAPIITRIFLDGVRHRDNS